DKKSFKNHCQSVCKQWLSDRAGPLPKEVVTHERYVAARFAFSCGICPPKHSGQGRFDGCFFHKYDQARHEWNKHKTYKYFVQDENGMLTLSPWDPREDDSIVPPAPPPPKVKPAPVKRTPSTRKRRKRDSDEEEEDMDETDEDDDDDYGARPTPRTSKPRATKRTPRAAAAAAAAAVAAAQQQPQAIIHQDPHMDIIKSEAQRILDSNLEQGLQDFMVMDPDAPGDSERDEDDDDDPESRLQGDGLWPSWVPRWVPRGENAESSSSDDDEDEYVPPGFLGASEATFEGGPISALPAAPPPTKKGGARVRTGRKLAASKNPSPE
ncbi:hypothetical protein HKX48_005137, partial [Thoreauomyces humboldtii]